MFVLLLYEHNYHFFVIHRQSHGITSKSNERALNS